MTKQLIKSYRSMNAVQRYSLILVTVLLLVIGTVTVAIAGSGITFSGFTPGEGTSVSTARPNLTANLASAEGGIQGSDVLMSLDGQAVVSSLTPQTAAGNYKVSYTPTTALADGNHTVALSVYDASRETPQTINWSFKVDAAPKAVAISPAPGAMVDATSVQISINLQDTYDFLNSSSIILKLNGTQVTPEFSYKGHVEYDSCGNSYWVNDSQQEGTLTYTANNLKDGLQTMELSIADIKGNLFTKTWSFQIAAKPVFSGITPANGALVNTTTETTLAVKATDDTAINSQSIEFWVDNAKVNANYNAATGIISYRTLLAAGGHTANVTVKDTAGNTSSANWAFSVTGDAAPIGTDLVPAANGFVNTASPKITGIIKDTYDNLNVASLVMKIDGVQVQPSFTLQGHVVHDSCAGDYYVIDNYRQGSFQYQTANLADGVHTVQISIADDKGNVGNISWSFTSGTAPTFTTMVPADKGITNTAKVSVVVKDNNPLNWNSLVMKIDNNVVTPVVDQATNTVTYQGSLTDGLKTVYVEVKDVNGNLGSTTWSFTYNTAGPSLEKFFLHYKANQAYVWGSYREITKGGITIPNGILSTEMRLKDTVDITKAELFIDDQPVVSTLQYPSVTDTCTGEVMITTKKEATVFYNQPLADGNHTLVLKITDVLGNTKNYSWPVAVNCPPLASEVAPVEYGVKTLTPTISAKLSDNNGTIIPASILLKVDGVLVNHNFDQETGKLTYTVTEPLADESYHTVNVSAVDNAGLTVDRTWKFLINKNAYPEMTDSSPNSCSACHSIGANALESAYHNGVPFSGDHGTEYNGCNKCHAYITYGAGCAQCHEDGDQPYAPHGSSPGIGYQAQNFDPNMPVRVKQNREMFDCIICHQPGARAGALATRVVYKDQWGYYVPTYNEYGELTATNNNYGTNYQYSNLLNNHDIPGLHKTTSSSCSECHAQSLTREHARPGRVDAANQAITCNSCHQSADSKVKTAIANKDKSCSACHGNSDHETLHASSLDSKCQACHQAALTGEHITNSTTSGKGYNCDTCHASQGKQVKRTITANSLNCAGCHSEAHNMLFVDKVPADIPLVEGFQWSTPIEAAIFAGEPTSPAAYSEGLVVLSNRNTAIGSAEIWQFYQAQLTAQAWNLQSQAPQAGTVNFEVEFAKQGRLLKLKVYNTATSNGSGAPIGTKVELWYK